MEDIIDVREATPKDWEGAIYVAWKVFQEFKTVNASEEGAELFEEGLTSTQLYIQYLHGAYELYCAYLDKKIVAMMTLKEGKHISLLFVDKEFRRMGIGTRLVQMGMEHCKNLGKTILTVNAAPSGMAFYLRNGFQVSGEACFEEGIRYTPMKKEL